MKIEIICRVCLEEGEMKSIFTTNCLNKNKISCAEAIIGISTVCVNENDGLPGHICKKCLSKLKAAYKFKILCEESYLKLTRRSDVNPKQDDNIDVNESAVKNEINILNESRQINLHESNCDLLDRDSEFEECDQNDYENPLNLDNDKLFDNTVKKTTKKSKTEQQKKGKRKKKQCESEISGKFQCKLCDKNFLTNDELKEHKDEHSGLKPYFCEICQKNFRSEYTHKALHASDRQLQCEICAKIFLRKASLRMHLSAHRNELPYQCTFTGCNKAFPQNSRLQLHLKVHTNERNFICQYCSHAARDKQQLTVHIRYFHTKEKNFLCGTCGKAFVSPQARYYHAKRHENIRNHHCPHCDKSFVFAFGLQEHLFTHTGEKRFACSICEARFSRKAHKEKHESRLHGIKIPTRKKNNLDSLSSLPDTV